MCYLHIHQRGPYRHERK
uniref:Uncharacterized protein n=1 Tax=Arundo donax TaxID=35708 RepID=A0A0A9GPZ0_ARUDO